jgi:hypothetical protein
VDLQLIRRLAAWATCSIVLVSVLYAPVDVRNWVQPHEYRRTADGTWEWVYFGEGHWVRSYSSHGALHSRSFLVSLILQSLDRGAVVPDWLRMAEEVLLESAIGGGLLIALRTERQAPMDRGNKA